MYHGKMPDCYADVVSFISRALHLAQLTHHDDLMSVAEEFRSSAREMGALESGHAQGQTPVSRNYRVLIDIMTLYADIGDLMETQLGAPASCRAAEAGPDAQSDPASGRSSQRDAPIPGGHSPP